MSGKFNLKEMLSKNVQQSGILLAFVVIVILFSALNPSFLSPGNITNIVLQYSYVLVLAIGMLFVIVLGQIDLSVGSVVAVTGALSAVLVIRQGLPWWVGVLAAIVFGLLIGAWQGFWVAFVGIPGFIVTLAGMLLFRGLTYQILDNVSLSPFPKPYYNVANGFLNGLLGGPGFDVFTLVIFAIGAAGFAYSQWRTRQGRIRYNQAVEAMWIFVVKIVAVAALVMWFGNQLANSRGLPIILILLAVLVLIYGLLAGSTTFGRNVYAIGGNKTAAALSGINVKMVSFWTYVNMGFLAAVAGVAYSARMNGAQPGAGNMFELDAIAACFIGGASTTGGIGKISGALIGGLIMAVLSNGMQLMGASTSMQQIVKGLVLLVAVAFDVYNKRRAGGQ
ncbi:multiple monosaccharide ABC transporter permease [Propionimicrobium sp. PCR01-08-3]|uniref:multiple monosaccharide ABC transporter permease n=1 Tax=Propionimicrobium sp. PCR01-08-3 TaxID=3052086 RepID=UPI00255C6DB9|nr:multiple monosaccharide ABC transporter permease [Propionimicrobium sp. PCR01-08-3]WIY83043.1 sugar ABC transporter permease [Propionimicrobium sp. PCR01-08-3]